MRTGHWVWTFDPDFNSGASGSGLQRILFSIDDGADSTLQVYEDLLFLTGNGTTRFIGSMSFTSSSSCTVELECATGDVTLSGFTTGNGVHSGTAWTWDDGTLYVGQNDDGSLAFTGSFSDVEDFNTAVTGTSASTQPGLTSAASGTLTVDSTSAAAQPGLTASAVGTLTVEGTSAITLDELTVTGTGVNDTEGQVIAQAEPLVADGAGAIGYGGAGAATLPGLETSAAGAMEITGTCAADMAGLECSATAVAVTADVDITMDGLVGTGVGVVNVSAGDVELTLAGLDAAGVGTLEMTGAAAIELPGLLAGSIGDSGMLTIPTGGQFVSSGGTLQRTAVLYGSPDAGAFVPPAHGTLAQTYPIIQHAGAPPAGAFVSHRSNWPAGLPVGPASAVMPVLVLSAVAPLSISGSAAMVLELLNVSAGSSGGVVTGAANMTIELTCAAFGGATLLTDRAGLPLTDRSGVQLTSRS
jgi:hypothetical protein